MENSASKKVSEVDFGYNHVNDGTRVVYPGLRNKYIIALLFLQYL